MGYSAGGVTKIIAIKTMTLGMLAFGCCGKSPKKVNLREERFNFAHGSGSLKPWSAGSINASLKPGWNTMSERLSGTELFCRLREFLKTYL